MLVVLQRAFLEHEIKADKRIYEERRQAEKLLRQNTRIIQIFDSYKEKNLDEKGALDFQIEQLKAKVDKCKVFQTYYHR